MAISLWQFLIPVLHYYLQFEKIVKVLLYIFLLVENTVKHYRFTKTYFQYIAMRPML